MKLILVLIALAVVPVDAASAQERTFSALSRVENCAKWRNPGCLAFAGQPGARRGPRGYAVFDEVAQGESALRSRIARGIGKTIRQFLREYNPGVRGYADRVAAVTGVDLDEVL